MARPLNEYYYLVATRSPVIGFRKTEKSSASCQLKEGVHIFNYATNHSSMLSRAQKRQAMPQQLAYFKLVMQRSARPFEDDAAQSCISSKGEPYRRSSTVAAVASSSSKNIQPQPGGFVVCLTCPSDRQLPAFQRCSSASTMSRVRRPVTLNV